MSAPTTWRNIIEEVQADRRRGKRIGMRFRVTIRGISEGQYFAEETHTVNVSEHGCCIETKHHMNVGDVISLEVRGRVHLGPNTFEIMHITRQEGNWVLGARLMETANVWGMSFPQAKVA